MASVHASVVLIGPRAVLIRGPSGAGKSALVLALLQAGGSGQLPLARLVADDRVHLVALNGRLVAEAPKTIAGLVELRGIGPLAIPHEPRAVIGLVVDLAATDGARLPEEGTTTIAIEGVVLPRIAVAAGHDALPLVLWAASAVTSR